MGGSGRAVRIGENKSLISRSFLLSCGRGFGESLCSVLRSGGMCLVERRSSPSCVCVGCLDLDVDCLLRTAKGVVTDLDVRSGRPCLKSVAGVLITTTSVSGFPSRIPGRLPLLSSPLAPLFSTGRSRTTPNTLLSSTSPDAPGDSPSRTSSSIGVAARMGMLAGSLVSSWICRGLSLRTLSCSETLLFLLPSPGLLMGRIFSLVSDSMPSSCMLVRLLVELALRLPVVSAFGTFVTSCNNVPFFESLLRRPSGNATSSGSGDSVGVGSCWVTCRSLYIRVSAPFMTVVAAKNV
jgi:hypothetical protein